MSLSLASPPNRILAHLDVRTTLSKKFTAGTKGRCQMHGGRAGEGPCAASPGKRNGATSSRRADQGRDCGAAETQRVAENSPRWAEMNASRRDMRDRPSRVAGEAADL